jgi:hypothetical protein
MTNEEKPHGDGVLDVIAAVSAKALSGRLDVAAGAINGALSFSEGKLVDARVGHLTGFHAINALASMRDVGVHFDPAAALPATSSISTSERLVLKQFFGIETVDSNDYAVADHAAADYEAAAIADQVEATTVIHSETGTAPARSTASHPRRFRIRYVAAFALGVLAIAIAAAAVVLRYQYRERSSAVATVTPATVEADPVEQATVEPTRVEPAPVETTTPVADTKVNEEPTPVEPVVTDHAPDLSGNWRVVNTVNTTRYRSFQNLQIGFAVSIDQNGTTFTAKGQKISENGRALPANSRTPIELKGFIRGDRVEATFSEQGGARKTNGRFVWKLDRAGGLMGTFASTAAGSSGKSSARREL